MENEGKNILEMLSVKTKIVIVLQGIFMIFILQNTEVVDIRFLFWKLSLSRVILLMGSLLIGILAGLFIGLEVSAKKKSGKTGNI